MLDRNPSLFGNPNRTAALVAIRLLEETYANELADVLQVRPFTVQSILKSLEIEGVIVTRLMGRTRIVSLNPRHFAHTELSALLWRLGENDEVLQRKLARRRRRPRRAGKPLNA